MNVATAKHTGGAGGVSPRIDLEKSLIKTYNGFVNGLLNGVQTNTEKPHKINKKFL